MKRTLFLTTAALSLALALAGCAPPYKQAFDDAASQNNWTKDQELAAFAYADRIFWAHETAEGSGTYVILYSKVPTAQVDKQLTTILNDFDLSLDPKNADMRQYVQTFNLQKDMEHEEAVTEVIYTRVHAANLETQFQKDMGEIPQSGPEAELAEGYDPKKIFLAKDVAAAFPFRSEVIDAAKKDGTLKQIEHITLNVERDYDHKAMNPNNMDDSNDFVWKPLSEALDLTSYKVITDGKPMENGSSYIEGYRIVNGSKETAPCIKVFFPNGGTAAIVLLDADREGEPGFGVPDVLEQLSLLNSEDIIRDDGILHAIFPEKKALKRQAPPSQVFKIEISRIGMTSVWEKAPNSTGFDVPFRYKDLLEDNYNIRIKLNDPDVDPNDPQAVAKALADYRTIQYIAKEYTKNGDRYAASQGAVIEYFHPKAPYDTKVKAKVEEDDDTKKVQIIFPDGTIIEGLIAPGLNKFIEGTPYAKSFNEGTKRWLIEKSTGTGVYDQRRLVSPPKESIGQYGDEEPVRIDKNAGTTGPTDMGVKQKQ
jgi:hypothetical protein